MIRYAYMALLTLACGGAASEDGAPPTERELPTLPPEPAPAPEPVVTPEPEPEPAVTEPEPQAAEPRGCSYDWQCQLRSSVCAPLEVGGDPVCRRPLVAAGDGCEKADDCEVGLVCTWAGIPGDDARVCAVSCRSGADGTDTPCLAEKRRPLACTDTGRVVDVSCEVEG